MISGKVISSCKSLFLSYSKKLISYSLVLAKTTNNGIGLNNSLPWKLPSDMKFFKDVTCNTDNNKDFCLNSIQNEFFFNKDSQKEESSDKINAVIMGRKTYESIPEKFRPLKK